MMRLGDVIFKQVIELRSRHHFSLKDDERLAAIYRWVLPHYYRWDHPQAFTPMSREAPANSLAG
jgi:hypothetical protein